MTLLPGARRGLALAAVCMMAACGGDDEPTPPPGPVGPAATIDVSADSVRLVTGSTAQLSAQVKAANGTVLPRTVAWSSSAPNVAEVLTAVAVATTDRVRLALSDGTTVPLQYSSGLVRGTTKPFYLATKQRGRLRTAVLLVTAP